MLVGVLHIWSRELRSVGDRADLAASLFVELDALPESNLWGGRKLPGWLFSEVVRIHLDRMEIDAARSVVETMRATATAHGDAWAVIEANELGAMVAVLDGHVAEGLDGISAAAHEARERGFEDLGIAAYRDAAVMAVRGVRYQRAAGWITDGLRYADAIEQSHCRHVIGATSALVDWAGGNWGDAAATARQAIADHGSQRAITTARWAVGYVSLGRGDFQTAEAELSAALSVGEESGAVDLVLPPLWGLAEAALLADRPEQAAARCHDALERARAVGERALLVPFVVTGVRAEQASGRPADAEAWLAACVAYLAAMPTVASAALDHGKGLVALAAGATGVSRHALEGAVDGWDARGRVWEATWARLDLASCLTRLNRFADAVALAVEARAVASRLDSRPLAERADALHRMARGHGSVDEPWRPLTAREFEVARLITEGLTNAEIARELSIASKTASSHVEHILAKLGASRRAEIAAWASSVERAPGR
jgi:DNA-binding CsgD family transcriptional regulator